jgi:hypothetical protein
MTARHVRRRGAESSFPGLGIVVADRETPLHERTVVLPAVHDVPEWPTSEDAQGFIDSFAEALEEHTAELLDLVTVITAAEQRPLVRLRRWFVRNLTGTRVTILVGTVGVLAGTGIGWWIR